jgi:uncharacterized protein YndB with AHSA1/START domain
MEYEVTTTIQASPQQVWAALSDIEHWARWTDSITSIQKLDPLDHDFGAGSRARVKQPRFPASTWVVDEWVPAESFTWTSRSGGVTTVADHEIAAGPDPGTTRVTHRIRQSGALAGLVDLLVGRRARRYVDMEAAGLKRASES